MDGVYTGRLFGELLHGQAKAAAVRSLAAREGLDLRRCTAYSDSVNDVPMLSVVGTAVAINPDGALRDVARERGWQIKDFRTGRKAAQDLGADRGRGRRCRRRGAGRPGGLAPALSRCPTCARACRTVPISPLTVGPLTGRPVSRGTGARGGAAAGTASAGSSPAPGR